MLCWISLEGLFSPDGALDVAVRNLPFRGQSVGQYGDVLTVKEIENPVVHATTPGSKLINAVAQVISLWPAQFMPSLGQAPDAGHAFGVGPAIVAT
jgi:hypothetical protein